MKSKIRVYLQSEPIEVETKVWAGGEVNVTIPFAEDFKKIRSALIDAKIYDSDGIVALLQTTDIIRSENPSILIGVAMQYLPYGRQDRVCNYGESFSLKVFANIINSQNYVRVYITDPHSLVGPALINNSEIISSDMFVLEIANKFPDLNWVIVAPDAGAIKRAEEAAKILECPIVYASKVRNPKTGVITGGRLDLNGVDVTGKDLLVVDDLCDGGRTFVSLAKMIDDETKICYNSLNLYVTHGIFSYGTDVVTKEYDRVFVACPFPGVEETDKVIII